MISDATMAGTVVAETLCGCRHEIKRFAGNGAMELRNGFQ